MTQKPNQPGNEPGNEPSPGPRKVRCIVPGRKSKGIGAVLIPVTVEVLHGEGPLSIAGLAMKAAEKQAKPFEGSAHETEKIVR